MAFQGSRYAKLKLDPELRGLVEVKQLGIKPVNASALVLRTPVVLRFINWNNQWAWFKGYPGHYR